MTNLRVLDGAAADKYLKASGAGSDIDPHIPEHKETSAAAILAAAQAIQTAAAAIQAAVETLDNVVAGSEAQVDVVSMPSVTVTGALTDTELRLTPVPVSGTVTASGPLTDTQLRAVAVPVSATALPLPTGAATSAKQDTEIGHLATLAGAVAGTEAQVDVVSSALPTGAATAANQTTLNGYVDGIETLLGTMDADTSTLAGAVAGTEVQVDIVGSLPAGTNAIGKLAANSGVDIGDVDVKSIAAGDNNIGNVDIASIAAGETLIGLVGASDIVVTITPTVAAEAHTAGDLLFDSTEVAAAVRANGGTAIVESITIIDKGDQKPSMHLVFANAATDFGAPGGVPDPDDTEALTVIGVVEVDTADYVDLGANSVVTVSNIGLLLKAGAATTSVYLAGIAVATPTPASTSDYQIAIGFLRS